MWNNAGLLGSIASISLYIAVCTGVIAAVAGFVSGLTANRASSLISEQSDLAIAVANAKAEEAKRDAEEIRAQVSWRRLSAPQAARLVEGISKVGREIHIDGVRTDPEALQFRSEIFAALHAAGVKHGGGTIYQAASGTSVVGPPGPERDSLASAFRQAGIPLEWVGDHERPSDRLEVVIGTRVIRPVTTLTPER